MCLEDFHKSQKNISIDTIKNYIPDIQSKTHKDLSSQIDQIVFSKDIFSNYLETLQELYLRRELLKLHKIKIMSQQLLKHQIVLKIFF